MIEKNYHIYVKDRCIYHSLKESEFKETWELLNNFIDIATEIQKTDLQYEEVIIEIQNSMTPSY